MLVRALALIAIGSSCLLFSEDEAGRTIGITKTERMEFPARGVLHLQHSIGELTVEGWDRPEIEITTTKVPPLHYDSRWREKSSHDRELEEVKVAAERHDDDVVISTTLPHGRSFPPPSPFRGSIGVNLHYQIQVPRNACLIIEHEEGEVNIEDMAGDIRVTTMRGEITLRLPSEAQYAIDAKSDLGSVVSDFPGSERRRPWLFGHRFVPEPTSAGHQLYLRTGFGDIIIQKIRKPQPPAPLTSR